MRSHVGLESVFKFKMQNQRIRRGVAKFWILFHLIYYPAVVNCRFIPGPGCNCRSPISSNELRISNRCPFTVWPGIVSYAGSPVFANGGFELLPFSTEVFQIPSGIPWSGKIWGRTGCQFSKDGCTFTCETGDCGQGLCCRSNFLNLL
jgi:hypothetical protein